MPASPAAVRQQNQLWKPRPRQQSQDYYSSRLFSPHKTLWKNKSRQNGRFGRAGLFRRGRGAEAARGTYLVSVAACEGLPRLWPAALGQAAPCPHGGGAAAAALQAAQTASEECATGSRTQPPAHGRCHRATRPLPRPCRLAHCAEGSVAMSSREGREAGNNPLGTG